MKPVRFVLVLLAAGLLVSAFAPVQLSNSVAQQSVTTSSVQVQNVSNPILDLSLRSPLAMMAAAPVIKITMQSGPLSSTGYSCTYLSQTPADWTVMTRRQDFDAKWTVRNTGARVWGRTAIDLAYFSGAKMSTKGTVFDLPKNVGLGGRVVLAVDMNAPKNNGWYTANWGLTTAGSGGSKKQFFCLVSISIGVYN
jgi:hypothetical protein